MSKKASGKTESLELNGIKLTKAFDDESGEGTMRFKFADTTLDISDDDGNKIGSISGCVGGAVEFNFGEGFDNLYYVKPQALWNAFMEALGKKEYQFKEESK